MNQDLLRQLNEQARARIVVGLSSDRAAQLTATFEDLLERVLAAVYRTPSDHNDVIAKGVGEELIEEVAALPPEDRMDFVTEELLGQRVGSVDAAAWRVAQAWVSGDRSQAIQARARELLREVRELSAKLEQRGGEGKSRYGRRLSEAMLDCEYVLGSSDKASLRLGRLLKSLE